VQVTIPVTTSTNQSLGDMNLQYEGPVVLACQQNTTDGAASADAGECSRASHARDLKHLGELGLACHAGGGLDAGAWVGIGLSIAAAVAILAAAMFLLVRRRRRASNVFLRSSSHLSKGSEDALPKAPKALDLMRQQQRDSSLGSMLRVQFGGLEGLEVGELVGYGTFGR
jgi:hypothetical protein